MIICHKCKEEVESPVYLSYTKSLSGIKTKKKYPFHKECGEKDIKAQAIWFEKMDANCNDCINFKGSGWDGKKRIGKCLIKNIDIKCFPNEPIGMECFRHRADNKTFNNK